MTFLDSRPFGFSRAGLLLAVWGIALIVAGALGQWTLLPVGLPWVIAALIGLVVQGTCEWKFQPINVIVWVLVCLFAVALAGWLTDPAADRLTFLDEGDAASGVMLLLAVGSFLTAMNIARRMWVLSVVYLVEAVLFQFVPITIPLYVLIFGLVVGLPLIVASLLARPAE